MLYSGPNGGSISEADTTFCVWMLLNDHHDVLVDLAECGKGADSKSQRFFVRNDVIDIAAATFGNYLCRHGETKSALLLSVIRPESNLWPEIHARVAKNTAVA
jgi:hypothetical protein